MANDAFACRPGYFGTLCDVPCPSGAFGRNCAGKCYPICSDEECNNVNGCFQNTMSTIKPTHTDSFQTTTGYMHLAATEEATVSDADQPIAKLDLNIIYIFAGAGIIIVMLIFGILVHLFKKSKSLERKLVIQQTFCENEKNTETLSQTQNLSRRYSSSNVQPCNKDHFYRTIEADYDEINEEFEMQVSPGDNRLRNENISMQGVVVKAQNTEESRTRTHISDLYLEPLFVPEVQESQNEEEINSNHSLEVIKET